MSFTSKIYTLAGGGSGIDFADDYVAVYGKPSGHMAPINSYFDYGDDKLYICGHDSTDGFFMELSNQGEILQQKTESNIYAYTSIHVDSSNDIYLVGNTQSVSDFKAVKYNSSMVHQWSKTYSVQSGRRLAPAYLFSIFNQSDYLGVAGYSYDASNTAYAAMTGVIKKSDGSIGNNTTFAAVSVNNTNQFVNAGAFTNSNGDAIIAGTTTRITNGGAFISKLWWNDTDKRFYSQYSSKGLEGSSNSVYPISMAKDSSTFYLFGYHQETGYKVGAVDAYLVKYNTSGHTNSISSTYEKGFGVSGFYFYAYASDTDGSYVYAVGSNGNTNYLIAINASNGTLAWQNKITGLGNFQVGLHYDANAAKLILVGTTGSSPNGKTVVMRIPKNGSGTGTYGSITYASTNEVSNYGVALTNTLEENYSGESSVNHSSSSFSNSTSNFSGSIESYD